MRLLKRRIFWAGAIFLGVSFFAYGIWHLRQRSAGCEMPTFYPQVMAKIKPGISLNEVESILGHPNDTDPCALVLDLYGGGILMHSDLDDLLHWWFDGFVVQIGIKR